MPIITIPRSSIKEINNEYVQIEINDTGKPGQKFDPKIFNETKGVLHGKADKLLKHVKNTRAEWDRL